MSDSPSTPAPNSSAPLTNDTAARRRELRAFLRRYRPRPPQPRPEPHLVLDELVQSPSASSRPRPVAMRRAWTVCFVLVPVLLLPILLIAPEWPLYHLWFFGIIVIGLLLWLRSLWWVGDWIHELAGQRWPHRFPQGADRGFFEPKRFSFLQWMAIAMQAPLLILGAAMGYGLSFECIPLIAIPAGLAGGAVFALIATWLVARIYNTWRYGSNLPIGNLIAYFVTAVILRLFSH